MEKAAPAVMSAASPALATIGGIAGGAVAGPPGAMVGAAAGGAAGKALQTKAETGHVQAGKTYDAGLIQGATEFIGGTVAPKVIAKVGTAAAKSADSAMAKILGLKFASKTRLGRGSVEQLEAIGNVVNKEVKGGVTLNHLASRIGSTKESLIQATDDMVQNASGSRLVPYESVVKQISNASQIAAKSFDRPGQAAAVKSLEDELLKKLPPNATVQKVLEVRRSLLRETDPTTGQALWAPGTRQFRNALYHELNRSMKSALPGEVATKFGQNNYKVSKLITAQQAIEERLARRVTGQEAERSLAEKAMHAGLHSALPAAGAYAGYQREGVAGAVGGAAAGYAADRALSSTAVKMAGIGVKRAVAAVAPHAARLSKGSPAAARAIEAIMGASGNK